VNYEKKQKQVFFMKHCVVRRRRFCLESGALLLERCTVWRFLCSLLAVNSSDVFAYPSPPLPAYRGIVYLERTVTELCYMRLAFAFTIL